MTRVRQCFLMFPVLLICGEVQAATQPLLRNAYPDSIRGIPAATPGNRTAVVTRMVLTADEKSASMNVEVALKMRNFDELQSRISQGELVSDAEKTDKYFPLSADHDKVVQWLMSQGLEVTRVDANRLAVFGRGSVDAVAAAFQVSFGRVALNGREFTSAVTAPSLPAEISSVVLGIHGLQPHIRRHPLTNFRAVHPNLQLNLSGYLPSDIAKAYDATGLSVTGSGQTIAVYGLAYPKTTDLTAFWSAAGVTQSLSNIQTVDVAGGPSTSASDDSKEEAALDVEWASSLAPEAKIRIYGASEDDPAVNDEILQQVYADLPNYPSMHVLSVSVGGNELDVPKDYLIIEAQYMANLASSGVTVLVASGDTGATAEGVVQTTYPTSDPDVTGVGGTTLTLSSADAVTSETAWSGSGGGISMTFARPAWQKGTGVPAGTMRLVPDVASAADPNQGALIYFNGSATEIGGTSWSAPTWAAFCALINQQRSAPLGLLNPKLYPLLGTSALRDITSGNNGAYNAGVGYDFCTGLGVPDVTALLAATLSSSGSATVPAQLGSQVVTLGQPGTFFVVGAGTPPLSYSWQRMPKGSTAWSPLSDTATYTGTSTPMLVVDGVTTAMSGDQFQCVVSNASGSATTSPSDTLTVNTVGVTTLAGWPGSSGHVDATGWAARFEVPGSVRVDANDNLYVADSADFTVRKVTAAGVVTTVAGISGKMGSTDGPVATALFSGIGGVAFDSAGNLYVADSGNYTIRKVSTAGVVSTLAGLAGTRGQVDGTASAARFYDPQNLALDAAGNIYVADGMGDVIRKVTPAGVVTTFAGSPMDSGGADGAGAAARFNDPTGVAVDGAGNVYIADNGNNTIRMISPAGAVTTLAGTAGVIGSADGSGPAASFNAPAGLGVDSSGNVYVADADNDTIRKVTPAGFVSTVAGAAGDPENIDGLATNSRLDTPSDVTIDSAGVVFVSDAYNSTIRRIIPGSDSAPYFTAQPVSQTVNLGAGATFAIGIAGTAPFTFQWYLNNSPIAGATLPFYTVANAQQSDAGSYSVSVANVDGSSSSAAATLTIALPAGYPDITAQPQGAVLLSGASVTLSVAVTGDGPISYQWRFNGVAISGANGATYAAAIPGSYTVSVSNSVATAVSSSAFVSSGSRLINISSRAVVQTGGGIAIAGFVIEGTAGQSKQVLIRGIGPALGAFGVSGFLASPILTLYNSSGVALASNTAWGTAVNASHIAAVSAQVGAFALISGSADSAMVATLTPGAYSAELSGSGSTTGVGLVEVYETDISDPLLLGNISTRAYVGTGADILIAGFVVNGTQPAKVLIRGVGPGLAAFGVNGVLALPTLTVYNASGGLVATNTGWQTVSNPSAIASADAAVGAFALVAANADSALLLTLQPGTYSVELTGVGGTTGIALVEVYPVPP